MKLRSYLIFTVLTVSVLGGAQAAETSFVYRSWAVADGLPQKTIRSITHTADGFLWLGTKAGISRFDGVRFKNYGLHEGLQGLGILSLLGDQQSGLWIATNGGGLSRLKEGKITTLTTADGLANNLISALATNRPDEVWVGGVGGLQHYTNKGFRTIGPDDGLPEGDVSALAFTPSGRLWIALLGNGLYYWENGRCQEMKGPDGEEQVQGQCMLIDQQNHLWVSIGNGKVLKLSDGKWQEYNQSHGLPHSVILCMAQSETGEIWAGSQARGLFVLQDNHFEPIPLGNQDDTSTIWSLAKGPNGILWAGTQSGGMYRLLPSSVRFLKTPDEKPQGLARGFTKAAADDFWVTTYGAGIFRGGFNHQDDKKPLPDLKQHTYPLTAITLTDGSVCVGGIQQFLHTQADGTILPTPDIKQDVTSLYQGRDDAIWLGTRQGELLKWRPSAKSYQHMGKFSSPISCIARGSGDKLWIATRGSGIFSWDQKILKHWDSSNGLPVDIVYSLYQDVEHTLWIGTAGGGLAWLHDGIIRSANTSNGLQNDFICQILEDNQNNLWLGSINGIIRVQKEELHAIADKRRNRLNPLVLDRTDGLHEPECGTKFSPAGLKDESTGILYFATLNGIAKVDPKLFTSQGSASTPIIDELRVDRKRLPFADGVAVTVKQGTGDLTVRFSSLEFTRPERIQYRYRLMGLNPEWVEVGAESQVRLTGLPPGGYTFDVSATINGSQWSAPSAPLEFSIEPFFWQTTWFELLVVAGLIALAAAGTRVVMQTHIKQAESRERIARAEAEVSEHQSNASRLSRLATLGNLSASISHEINQPLAAILSNAQAGQRFLDQEAPPYDEVRQILKEIIADDQRASTVIQRVKKLLNSGSIQLQPLAINNVITEITPPFGITLESKGVRLITQLEDGLKDIVGDPVQLQQVLINLITNAAEAMGNAATPEATITIITRYVDEQKGEIQVSVVDLGPGLPEGEEDQIFKSYHSTKTTGIGLGLSLSKTILLAHRGRIWYHRNADGHTEFSFAIPTADRQATRQK